MLRLGQRLMVYLIPKIFVISKVKTNQKDACRAEFEKPGCYLQSWFGSDSHHHVRRGCFDYSQPEDSFTTFLKVTFCNNTLCNTDKSTFQSEVFKNL